MFTKSEKYLIVFLLLQRLALFGIVFLLLTNRLDQPLGLFQFIETFTKRWDANGYQHIAQYGYVNQGEMAVAIVFPPFYPLLIRLVAGVTANFTIAAFTVSNSFFLLGCLVFYRLLRLDYSKNFSFWAIVLLSFFPTSFFFSIGYPESVFFALFSLTFLFLKKQNFLLAGMFAGLATLTRPFGVALWPAVFITWLFGKRRLSDLLALTSTLLVSGGIYLLINYATFGDPLAFQKILNQNWQKHFGFPWIGIIDSWKRGIFTPEWGSYKFLVGYAEAIASTVAWVFGPLVFLKRFKIDNAGKVYYLASVILFTSTAFILSAPRYLLSIPIFFVILAHLSKHPIVKTLLLATFAPLLVYFAMTIAMGQWAF